MEVQGELTDDPSSLAERLRRRVDISLDEQQTWREPYTALRAWTEAIESVGVLVSQFSDVEVAETRGFSIGDQPYPLIALNGKDAPRAKIFTLFHELAHIALGAAGICDLHESDQPSIEKFCNQVAAEALVPGWHLLDQPIVAAHRRVEWADRELQDLSTAYAVSGEVVLRRLLTLGRTSLAFYRRKRREYLQRQEDTAEAGGFMPYFRRVLRDNGAAFTSLALEAYYADAISSIDLSRLLGGFKLQHLGAIEKAVRRGRR